ncbi:CLUMA_CG017025, isoform A [Clunio marinus]|uniref:CLUMA_CG017025, isoform A n=1 Tax=Clunio marinus TaxID=568069 RepID=A0A1J1IUP1_9DIPT|nr:CLUMA_CG017025, isoform A [Clunio marinus]
MEKTCEKLSNLSIDETAEEASEHDCLKWGLPLNEIYKLSLKFYKDKSGKAVHLSYEENLKLVALTMQANHGPMEHQKLEALGVFDVIGKNRREQWATLGLMSKLQAMEGFIDLLDRLCPAFKPYVEAIKKDQEEKKKQAKIDEEKKLADLEVEQKRQEERKIIEYEKHREEIQRRKLQDALNQQTFYQFKDYAEKQFPGNPEQQAILIKQLQTEHYHQYLQQLQSQLHHNELKSTDSQKKDVMNSKEQEMSLIEEREKCDSDEESGEYAVVQPANMWTRSDIKEFKHEVMNAGGDGVIRVGHGDCLTVRVPTLEGGSSLFWEFATDSYDIGFGVYFEWSKPDTTEVTVHVSESDDELDENEAENDDEEEITSIDDLESGSQQMQQIKPTAVINRPPLSIIVPVYRRECQNEVYAGSHNYPGEGTYLLKFDNTYSLWRSKTLYYRIFYTR